MMPRGLTLVLASISLLTLGASVVLFAAVDYASAELLIFTPSVAAFVVIGAFVLQRQPSSVVGVLLLVFGVGGSVIYPLAAIGAAPAGTPSADVAGAFVQALDPMTYATVSLLLLVFPDGRLPSARWRPLVAMVAVGFALSVVGNLTTPGALLVFPQHENPVGVASPVLTAAGAVGYILATVSMLAAAASLVVRWRRGSALERAQLKWIAASGLLLAFVSALYLISFFLWAVALLPLVASSISFTLFPATVAIAVLRYRLFEIDRILSRTIGWAIVTGLLLAVFAGAVVGLQAVLAPVTANNTLAVAASTLVAAALFQPLRARVQHGVDRRFNRSRVDADRAVARFVDHARNEVDLARLRAALVATADDAVHPSDGAVWLRGVAQ